MKSSCTSFALIFIAAAFVLGLTNLRLYGKMRGNGNKVAGFDAIIVAAGGQTAAGPPPHVEARIERAAELYKATPPGEKKPLIITTAWGTPHKPCPHDAAGFEVHESSMNARQLIINHGIDPSDVVEESVSLETVGNAYFTRVMHCDPLSLSRIAVVNNRWHMPRTKAVYSFVFSLPLSSTSQDLNSYEFTFISVDDALPADVLAARLEKEAKATPRYDKGSAWQKSISTMQDMHRWIFHENTAYASKRLLHERKPIDPKLLASY